MGSGTRWSAGAGPRGEAYDARFAELAASGADVHGEATLCHELAPVADVLDAGCGTGRVAHRLAALGHRVVGVDVDPDMLGVARAVAPPPPGSARLDWVLADLVDVAGLPQLAGGVDLVVAAGNVVPLLAPGAEAGTVAALAAVLRPGGVLVAGFGLDAAHLPLDEPPFGLEDYDRWCAAAGLVLTHRWSSWSRDPMPAGPTGYAVSVHASAQPLGERRPS